MTFLHRCSWLLSTFASGGELFLTLFYWAVLYDPNEDKIHYWNLLVHLCAYLVMLIDIFVTARPWKWQHFYLAGIMALT